MAMNEVARTVLVVAILALCSFVTAHAWEANEGNLVVTCETKYDDTSYTSITEEQKKTIRCYESSWLFKEYCPSTNSTCVAAKTFGTKKCASYSASYSPYLRSGQSYQTGLMWCPIGQVYDKSSTDPDSFSARTAWLYCSCEVSSYVPALATMALSKLEGSSAITAKTDYRAHGGIRQLWNTTRILNKSDQRKVANMVLDESMVGERCVDEYVWKGKTYTRYDGCIAYKPKRKWKTYFSSMIEAVESEFSITVDGWCPTEIDDDNNFVKGGLCTNTYVASTTPTMRPTSLPTVAPTLAPVNPTPQPTMAPTLFPTSHVPTVMPTVSPTRAPTRALFPAIHVHFLMAFEAAWDSEALSFIPADGGDGDGDGSEYGTALEEQRENGTGRLLAAQELSPGNGRWLQAEADYTVSNMVADLRCVMQEMIFNSSAITALMGETLDYDEPAYTENDFDGSQLVSVASIVRETCISISPPANSPLYGLRTLCEVDMPVTQSTSNFFSTPQPTSAPSQKIPTSAPSSVNASDASVAPTTSSNGRLRVLQAPASSSQGGNATALTRAPTPAPTDPRAVTPAPTTAQPTPGPRRQATLQTYLLFLFGNATRSPLFTPERRNLRTGNGTFVSPAWVSGLTTSTTASLTSAPSSTANLSGDTTPAPTTTVTTSAPTTSPPTPMATLSPSATLENLSKLESYPFTRAGGTDLRDRDVENFDNDSEQVCPVNITELLGASESTLPPSPTPIAETSEEDNTPTYVIVGVVVPLLVIFFVVVGLCKSKWCKTCKPTDGKLGMDDEVKDRSFGKSFVKSGSSSAHSAHDFPPQESLRIFSSSSSHGDFASRGSRAHSGDLVRNSTDGSSEGTNSSGMEGLSVDIDQLALGPVIGNGASGRIFMATYFGSEVAVKELFPRAAKSHGSLGGKFSLSRQSTASAGDGASSVGSRPHRVGYGTAFPARYMSNSSTVRSNSTSSNLDVSSRATTPTPEGARRPSVDENDAYTNSSVSDRSPSVDATIVSVGASSNGLVLASATAHQVPEHELFHDASAEDDGIFVGVGVGESSNDMLAEVKNLRRLRHPNVIRLFGCTRATSNDTGGGRFLVVMELAACSLQDLISRSPKSQKLSFKEFDMPRKLLVARQIAAGMAYIHENSMIHFDVKCENVLLDTAGQAKICDLGIAKFTMGPNDKVEAVNHQGTPAYMAPELLRENEGITNKIDVYSYGLVLWQILYERPLHPRTWTVPKLFYEVRYNKFRPQIDESVGIDSTLVDLIQKCWDEDPDVRPSFHQVIKILDEVIDKRKLSTEVLKSAKFSIGDSVGVWDYKVARYLPAVVIDIEKTSDGGAVANVRLKANGEMRRSVPQVELIPKPQFGLGPATMHSVGGLALLHSQAMLNLPSEVSGAAIPGHSRKGVQDASLPPASDPPPSLGLELPALQPMSLKFVADDVAALKQSAGQAGDVMPSPFDAGHNSALGNAGGGPMSGLASETKTFRFINERAIDLQGIRLTEGGLQSEGKETDSRIKDDLYKYAELGKGVSGTVSAALHLGTFDLCAIKEIRFTNRSSRHQAVRELNALYTKLGGSGLQRCPYIVWMYEAYLEPHTQSVCLVMELMDGGSLQDLLARFKQASLQALANQSEMQSRSIFGSSKKTARGFNRLRSRQSSNETVLTHGSGPSSTKPGSQHGLTPSVASPLSAHVGMAQSSGVVDEVMLALISRSVLRALAYLHENSFVHLDIKPANILINSRSQVKLADFGLSKQLESDRMASTFAGTMKYMSPERLRGENYSFPSDIWSFGLTLMTVILGEFPMFLITDGPERTMASQTQQTGGSNGKPRQSSVASISGGSTGEVNEPGQGSSVYWKLLERWDSGRAIELPAELVHFSPLLELTQRVVRPSEDLRDFIKQMLALDPNDRPPASKLLKHPWLARHDQKLDLDMSSSNDDKLVMANAEASRATLQDIAFGVMSRAARNPLTRDKIGVSSHEDGQGLEIAISDTKMDHLAEQIMLPTQVVTRSFKVAAAAHHHPKRRPLVSSSSSASSNISLAKQK